MECYFERQRQNQREKMSRLAKEASGMSTNELIRSLEWQQTLAEHADEIGASNPSQDKLDVINQELRSRGIR